MTLEYQLLFRTEGKGVVDGHTTTKCFDGLASCIAIPHGSSSSWNFFWYGLYKGK